MGQILSQSVYVESLTSPELPFGSRARIYPGTAPLGETILDELPARYAKHPVTGRVEGSNKTLEHGSMEIEAPPTDDFESGGMVQIESCLLQ